MDYSKIIPEDLFNFILTNVKVLLNIEEPSNDASEEEKAKYNNKIQILTIYINTFCQNVIIKTNRIKFPKGLRYLAITSTVDMYNQYINASSNSEDNQVIQSMSETGRSVSFGVSDLLKIKFQLLIQQQINDNISLINSYKLLYKVRCPENEED